MRALLIPALAVLWGVISASGQTARVWTSNFDPRWSRGQNWSGSNQPNANNEVAEFGLGTQLNPELDSNSYTVRGLRFRTGAAGYNVGDDNGARTLRIGNATSGFIEQLSANRQTISLGTLSFQSNSTITTASTGGLEISSRLTGTNRNLTFNANGTIVVSGAIATGSGTLTKTGAGDLQLSGANTFTGTTSIGAGSIVAGASGIFADTARVDIASGASLRMAGFSDVMGRLTGMGTVDFGSAGTSQLTLSSGTSQFSGTFSGAGTLILGAGATPTLGADFDNTDLNITLAGGRLNLAGSSISIGTLDVTADSILDFSSTLGSQLSASNVLIGSMADLSVRDWTDAADWFLTETGYVQGSAPLNQITFQGWSAADTKWTAYDERGQISPVPEPAWYGAAIVVAGLVLLGGRRRRKTGAVYAGRARRHRPGCAPSEADRMVRWNF